MSDESAPARGESRYASRKFLLACSVIAAGHVALYTQAIQAAHWLDLMKWTAGLYFAGNAATWLTDAIRPRVP